MRRKLFMSGVLVACTATIPQWASAYEAGDLIVRMGAATVAPREDSSALSIAGVGAIAGSGAGVDDNTQLGITLTYMLNRNWGLGLLAATPFEHDVDADTGALGLGRVDAASIKHLPPSLTLQYHPLPDNRRFQPYIGAGVNYTTFFSESVDSELEAVLGNGDLELDDSWGLALEMGIDVALDDRWTLNAAIWYLDIDTEATFEFDSGAVLDVDVDVDPLVYAVNLAYRF